MTCSSWETGGEAALRAFLLGSTVQEAIARSPIPVVVTRLTRRSALARDLRLSAHRRAARPDAASTARLTPRNRAATGVRTTITRTRS